MSLKHFGERGQQIPSSNPEYGKCARTVIYYNTLIFAITSYIVLHSFCQLLNFFVLNFFSLFILKEIYSCKEYMISCS